jgi:hypothetical protein
LIESIVISSAAMAAAWRIFEPARLPVCAQAHRHAAAAAGLYWTVRQRHRGVAMTHKIIGMLGGMSWASSAE